MRIICHICHLRFYIDIIIAYLCDRLRDGRLGFFTLAQLVALALKNRYKLRMSANDPYLGGYVPGKQETLPPGMHGPTTRGSYVVASDCVMMPAGAVDDETFKTINHENVGPAYNRKLQIMNDPNTPPAVVDKIADSIIDRKHGKVGSDAVNVAVQVNTHAPLSETDKEILAMYRQKIIDDHERMKDAKVIDSSI